MKKVCLVILVSFFLVIGLIIFPKVISMPTQVQEAEEPATSIRPKVEVATSTAVQPRLTIVYDNNPYNEGWQSDWGFACLIEGMGKIILFDTGADGLILLANMDKLGIEPKKIDIIVLSHIHSDHTGGLFAFLEQNKDVEVYLLESFSYSFKEQVRQAGARIIEVSKSAEICPNVYTTGELGSGIKEQALVLVTGKGLVVITGCAHPGIVEITSWSRELINSEVLLVLGGFHLFATGEDAIANIIAELQKLGVINVAPCHCSGDKARQMFKDVFKDHYLKAGVGRAIEPSDLMP